MCDGIRLTHTRLTLEAMTLTDADPIRSTAEDLGGTELRRQPITDPAAYLDGLDGDVRSALRALGELLVGVVERPARGESADRFTARCLGGPVLLILEDVDLWCGDRNSGASGLSELLQAMDIAADARILSLASTNDASTLDKAAIRTGRFDSIVEVRCPNKADAARILTALVDGLPGGISVDTDAVVAALPEHTTGSDLREIVRRAVLNADDTGQVTSDALLAEVGSGRYRPVAPEVGMYL